MRSPPFTVLSSTLFIRLLGVLGPLTALAFLCGCKSSAEKAVGAFTSAEGCATRTSVLSSPDDAALLEQGPSCPQTYPVVDDTECKKLQGAGSCVVHASQQKDGPTLAEYCVSQTADKATIDGACSVAAAIARNYLSVDDCKDRAKLIYRADANSDLLANSAGAAQTCRLSIKTVDPTECVTKLHATGICSVKVVLTSGETHNVCVRRDANRLAVDFRCSEGIASPSDAHRIIAKLGDKYDSDTPAKDYISVAFTEQRQPEIQYAWIWKKRPDADRILGLLKAKSDGAQLTARLYEVSKSEKTWRFEELLGEGWGETDTEDSDDAAHIAYTSGRDMEGHSSFALWNNSLVITSELHDAKVLDVGTGHASPLPGGAIHTTGATTIVDGKLIAQEYKTNNLVAVDLKDGSRKTVVRLDPGQIRGGMVGGSMASDSQGDVAWFQTTDAEYDDWSSALYVVNVRTGAKKPTKLHVFPKDDHVATHAGSLAMSDSDVFVLKADGVYAVTVSDPKKVLRRVAVAELDSHLPQVPYVVFASKVIAIVDSKGVLVVDPTKPDSTKRIVSEGACLSCSQGALFSDGNRVVYFDAYRKLAQDLDIATGKLSRIVGSSGPLTIEMWKPMFITTSGLAWVRSDDNQVVTWTRPSGAAGAASATK
jgi:hypothetical protein